MLEATTKVKDKIEWMLYVTPPRSANVTAVRQLYHGALAPLSMCRDLLDRLSDQVDKDALQSQIADESRQIGIFKRYLGQLGKIAPPEPALEAALERRYIWEGSPLESIIAVHLLLEGEGLRIQPNFGR